MLFILKSRETLRCQNQSNSTGAQKIAVLLGGISSGFETDLRFLGDLSIFGLVIKI